MKLCFRVNLTGLLVIVFLCAFTPNVFAQTCYKVMAEKASVRSAPSSQSSVMGSLKKGEMVMVTNVVNGWVSFPYKDGIGYASIFVVKKVDESDLPATKPSHEESTSTSQPTDTFVPQKSTVQKKAQTEDNSLTKTGPDVSDEKQSKNINFFDLGYAASSFKEPKYSGGYGYSGTHLFPMKKIPDFYYGVNFQNLYNFGLVDSDFTSADIRLGPVLGYNFSPYCVVALPVDVVCCVGFDSDTHTSWGMAISPSCYFGKKRGVYFGLQFLKGFKGGGKFTTGFRVGIYL